MATEVDSNVYRERLMAVPLETKDNIDGKYSTSNGGCSPSPNQSTTSSGLPTPKPEPKLDLHKESDRLKTFAQWPVSFISSETAAKNGFYYVSEGDTLKCFFCKVEVSQWVEGDDVEADHGRWAPQCPLLLKKPVGNIPSSKDECGTTEVGMFRPAHSLYMTEASRLLSYKFWPQSMKQQPGDLAAAGFYYSGVGDQAICYYCGGGLKDWEEGDDPWEQHALWFSKCPYLINIKGSDYIRKIKSKFAESSPSSLPPTLNTSPPLASRSSMSTQLPSMSTQQVDTTSQPATPPPVPAVPVVTPLTNAAATSEDKLCRLCFDQERNVCFVPCGHVVTCVKCAMSLSQCPMCREPYSKLVKLYFS